MTHILLNGESSVPKIPRTDVDSPSGNVVTSRRGGGSGVRRRSHESSSTRVRIDPAQRGSTGLAEKNCEIPWQKEAAMLDDTFNHVRLDSTRKCVWHASHRGDTQRHDRRGT